MKVSIDSVQSIAIRNEYIAAHCNHAEYLGAFRHPAKLDNADAALHLYSVCGELVFGTNGDPVWQVSDPEGFDALVAEYGIDIEAAKAE
jgi:hypothetical protein